MNVLLKAKKLFGWYILFYYKITLMLGQSDFKHFVDFLSWKIECWKTEFWDPKNLLFFCYINEKCLKQIQ